MKKNYLFLLLMLAFASLGWGQDNLLNEDFSTGALYTVTLGGEGTDGTADYFMRTDGSNINISYTSPDGYFFAGQDIDDGGWTGSAKPSELTWSNINISSYTDLTFKGKFASYNSAKIDNNDYLHVQYRIDAGSWTNLIWFENDGTTYNTAFLEDTDFNGDGDGTQLTASFVEFTKSISGTGSILDLKITCSVDAGSEDFAIDDFIIEGTSGGSPTPTITVSPTSLTGFTYEEGNGPSTSQSFTVSGSDLTANITVTPPTNYEISTDNISFQSTAVTLTQSGGSVGETTLYARLKAGLSIGDYNLEDITATSTDASDKTVSCSGSVTGPIPELMITEIMQNPAFVLDDNGEYFEIYNYGSTTVDIDGFLIKDAGADSHTISNGGALNITAGGFLVLGIDGNSGTNGGVSVDYKYTGFTLGNGDDEVILYYSDGTTEIDRVEYDGGPNWPDPTGASMIYTGTTAQDNNTGSLWTTSIATENGFDGTGTDFGSPGTNGLYQNLITTTTWTGTGNWSEGNAPGNSNWSNGSPGSNVNVVIGGDVTIDLDANNPAECLGLTINNSQSVTVSVGSALTINDGFTNGAGTLTIESDATGDGSVIVYGGMIGPMDIERFITPYSGVDDGWHLLSIPRTSSFNLATSDFVPSSGDDDVYNWNEVSYTWENYFGADNPGFDFEPGYGYLVAYKSQSSVRKFSGYVNNQDIVIGSLTLTDNNIDDTYDGWNLIGNPYSSAIKWNDGNWTLNNINTTAKVYNETSGNYLDVAANGIIPMNQGFFVQVNNASGGSVTIPLASRAHSSTNWYKSMNVEDQNFTLKVSGGENTFYDYSTVRFSQDATINFDTQFDSHKLYGMPSAPQLMTKIGNEELSTNVLPFSNDEFIIPLAFAAGTNGNFQIEVVQNTIASEGHIYLEDLFTNQMINLSEQSSYSFLATIDDESDRFLLHFNGVTGVEDIQETSGLQVYSNDGAIYINSLKDITADILVYNINGQLLQVEKMNAETFKKFNLKASSGVYLVNVVSEETTTTQKVYVK